MNSIKSKLSNCGKPGTNGATVRVHSCDDDNGDDHYEDDYDEDFVIYYYIFTYGCHHEK